jgi:DNA-binding MarR family transcriptional regulator
MEREHYIVCGEVLAMKLSHAAKLAFFVLLTEAVHQQKRTPDITVSAISRFLVVTRATIQRGMKALEKAELIRREGDNFTVCQKLYDQALWYEHA